MVKRIWTPSWVLFSGGWCLLFLAAFYAVLDVMKVRFWAFPLRVIGMNSIAAYCMAGLWEGFIARTSPPIWEGSRSRSPASLTSRYCMARPCFWSSG